MIPILTADKIREGEKFTMKHDKITSLELMERAGIAFVERLLQDIDSQQIKRIFVFCGPGNNGGDGLVIARTLSLLETYSVSVVLVAPDSKTTPEFEANLQRIRELEQEEKVRILTFGEFEQMVVETEGLTDNEDIFMGYDLTIRRDALFIDAMFGIGLSRPLEEPYKHIIAVLNRTGSRIVAVDCPSGMFVDRPQPDGAWSIRADKTYTFQWMKWGFLMPEDGGRCGEVRVLDIGMQIYRLSDANMIYCGDARAAYKDVYRPQKFAHKGTNGHAVLFAGSRNMPGAAILSATAAMRSGIGKLTLHTTPNVAQILPAVLPEAIVSQDVNGDCISDYTFNLADFKAVGIGPGIGKSGASMAMFRKLLEGLTCPIVIDADALNLLAEDKSLLDLLHDRAILTPHIGEFDRLVGHCRNHFERIEKMKAFAKKYRVIMVLKGAYTIVCRPDGFVYVNTTGNPGMATAGSGDVLTGIILGMLTRGFRPIQATLFGVCLHGLAGDCALKHESVESLLASDICKHLGEAFRIIGG